MPSRLEQGEPLPALSSRAAARPNLRALQALFMALAAKGSEHFVFAVLPADSYSAAGAKEEKMLRQADFAGNAHENGSRRQLLAIIYTCCRT